MNSISNSTYLAVVVVPGRILVDFGFLVVTGRAAAGVVPTTKSLWGTTILGGLRTGSKVFAEVAVCECSESSIEVPVMLSTADACGPGMVSVADISGAGEVLIILPLAVASSDVVSTDANNDDAARVLAGLLVAPEASMFSVFETELGSISWLCTYIERYQFKIIVIYTYMLLT
jgi:hypothetical protein